MPTFNGWNIVFVPAYPPAPSSIEFMQNDAVAMNVSPFTGGQQILDWNATWMEASVSMPAMKQADAENWVTFLRSLKGSAGVFQFSAAFQAAYPAELIDPATSQGRFWRLKSNQRKWSVATTRFYGVTFDVIEAVP